ncbi:phage scaffolding protein [Paenibacillus polymyxa]|uniref:phage scaffolding protein n=1 Tax=Paenibacillus polymyxa TaxID=1406 RepID=UPI002023EA20|nr:phage scaffolding protein [Paenibacillus polymyxa]URJ46386.1 phage scaffolding protein [Paenibacillus polymyxa]
MDWLRELLEGQGVPADKITAITKGVEDKYTGYVPKHRFDEINDAKKQLEGDLKERDKQLADLQKAAGDVPALQDQITKLQEDNKAATDKYNADMQELRLNTALKMALSGQVHNADIVAKLLDKTRIELDDNGAIKNGLDDQLTGLRESDGFLFVPKEDGNTQPTFKGAKPAEGAGAGNPPAPLKGYDAGKSIAEQRNGSEK